MLQAEAALDDTRPNHPLARRMAIIGFLANNIATGTLFGSFSVLLSAVEARLGVDRAASSLGIPAATMTMTLCAALVGVLAGRLSLRLLMIAGATLSTAGFVLLAATRSYPLYLLSYGALLGPGMAIGVVLPPTLVTRWFHSGRGRVLGIVSMPVLVAIVPLASTWTLQTYGLTATYAFLAGLSAVAIVAALFVVDHPPETATAAGQAAAPGAAPTAGAGVADLLRSPRFWLIAVAAVSSTTASVVLSAHMVPMGQSWGYTASLSALLLSIQSLIGIFGTVVFGWIGDRFGGVNALLLIVVDGGLLWLLLLLHPPFPVLVVLIALIGLHGAGTLPILGLVLSQTFGPENFSRVYGIASLFNLPFAVVAVPAAALVFTRTGSYDGAIIGQVAFFAVGTLLVLALKRQARTARQA